MSLKNLFNNTVTNLRGAGSMLDLAQKETKSTEFKNKLKDTKKELKKIWKK